MSVHAQGDWLSPTLEPCYIKGPKTGAAYDESEEEEESKLGNSSPSD